MSAGGDRAAMTLDVVDILQLARAARRSPHARRVLHDALLELYGPAYEEVLATAQRRADEELDPYVIVLRPYLLKYVLVSSRSPTVLGGAITLSRLRLYRAWQRRQTRDDWPQRWPYQSQVILLVRPRSKT